MIPEMHLQELIEERVRHNTRALLWLAVISLVASVLLLLQHYFVPVISFEGKSWLYTNYTAVYVVGMISAILALGLCAYLLFIPAAAWYNYLVLSFAVFFVLELSALAVLDSGDGTDVSAYIIGIMVFVASFRIRNSAALVVIVGISLSFYLVHWSLWGLMNLNDTLTVLFVTLFGVWIFLNLESRRTENFLVRRELDIQNKKLTEMSATDPLTGIMNRRSLLQNLYVYYEDFKRYATPVSLAMIDIDHFKAVNDTYGHQVGDQVLAQFAQLIGSSLRATDRLARYGGEEFVVVLPHLHCSEARDAAERLRRIIADTPFSEHQLQVTASFGVAEFTAEDPGSHSLIKRADEALYTAKHLGRNRVVVTQ